MITGSINAIPTLEAVIDFSKGFDIAIENKKDITASLNNTQVIAGEINLERTITGIIKTVASKELNGNITLPKVIKAENYEGDYNVIPKTYEQSLLTKNKHMKDNVLIHEIPYYETSNLTGTTIYIGGE